MKLASPMTALTIAGLHATTASAADYHVQRTLQLSSPSAVVWNMVGDFCDIDDWHPALAACTLKVIDGGLHRNLTTTDGSVLIEKRIAVEPGLSYTYTIVESSLPIENYVATFSVESLDGSLISWSGSFTSDDPRMEAAIAEMYDAGLSAIESHLAQ